MYFSIPRALGFDLFKINKINKSKGLKRCTHRPSLLPIECKGEDLG